MRLILLSLCICSCAYDPYVKPKITVQKDISTESRPQVVAIEFGLTLKGNK